MAGMLGQGHFARKRRAMTGRRRPVGGQYAAFVGRPRFAIATLDANRKFAHDALCVGVTFSAP